MLNEIFLSVGMLLSAYLIYNTIKIRKELFTMEIFHKTGIVLATLAIGMALLVYVAINILKSV